MEYFYWDVSNLGYYGLLILFLFLVLIASIIFHELGHYMWFKMIKKRTIKIHYKELSWEAGTNSDYSDLSEKEYFRVNVWGVINGTIPILFASALYPWAILMLLPYGWGCRQDIHEIIKRLNLDD